jgi:hypothetical protein
MLFVAYVKSDKNNQQQVIDSDNVVIIVPLVDTKKDALAVLENIGIKAFQVDVMSHFVEQADFEENTLPDKSVEYDLWNY